MDNDAMHPYHVYPDDVVYPCDFVDCYECPFANCCSKSDCVLPHFDPFFIIDGGDMFE